MSFFPNAESENGGIAPPAAAPLQNNNTGDLSAHLKRKLDEMTSVSAHGTVGTPSASAAERAVGASPLKKIASASASTPTRPSESASTVATASASSSSSSSSAPSETPPDPVRQRFIEQHLMDRMRAAQPDYETPFRNAEDICSRLVPFHIMAMPSSNDVSDAEWRAEYDKRALALAERLRRLGERWQKHLTEAGPAGQRLTRTLAVSRMLFLAEKTELEFLRTRLTGAAVPPSPTVASSFTVTPVLASPSSRPTSFLSAPPLHQQFIQLPFVPAPPPAASPSTHREPVPPPPMRMPFDANKPP